MSYVPSSPRRFALADEDADAAADAAVSLLLLRCEDNDREPSTRSSILSPTLFPVLSVKSIVSFSPLLLLSS